MGKSNCDALKRLAKQAKNRLGKRKYFQGSGNYKVYNGGLIADYKLILLSSGEDERFYARVKEILKENEDIVNPLGKLVDRNRMEQMSKEEKERYIINLSEKYLKMKARFERENLIEEFAI